MNPLTRLLILRPVKVPLIAFWLLICGTSAISAQSPAAALGDLAAPSSSAEKLQADLLVVGATESGWAAALQAARLGVDKIVVVHDGDWIGGQFTEQALACVDENKGVDRVGWGVDWHPMKRAFHRSGLFKELMDRIEQRNRQKYGSAMPGRPYHGPSTFRPADAEQVFRELLQPYVDDQTITMRFGFYPIQGQVDRSGDLPRVTGISFASAEDLKRESVVLQVEARLTIDASDWGEAIQVTGTGFECGPDPPSRYGEPSAPADAPQNEMNPITWPMIVVESDSETPIDQPRGFDDRNYPRATFFSAKQFGDLDWDVPTRIGAIAHWPDSGTESRRQLSVYTVRRIVDGHTSRDGTTSILLNYMNGQDYPLERLPRHVRDELEKTEPGASQKNIVRMTRQQRQIIYNDAKRHALGVLYHLQNFVHDRAPDKTNSFRRFHLSDEFGTSDRLPPKPYIRESLRLQAMYMMREQDGRNRDGEKKDRAQPRFAAVMYPDGLFAWQFHYDFHRTGRTYLKSDGDTGPWIDFHKPNRHTSFLSDRSVFPLRSLIPAKMDGLIGAQGNVGFSSIVSAALRLHDQRIHIGQAAGAAAAVSLRTGVSVRSFPYDREQLEAVREALCGEMAGAVPLLIWPYRDLSPDHPSFVAVNRMSALGLIPNGPRDVDFRPDAPAEPEWVAEVLRRIDGDKNKFRFQRGTRGELCRSWWPEIQRQGWSNREWSRMNPADADGDGIADRDDAFLFTPNEPIRFQIERPPLLAHEDGVPPAQVLEESIHAFDFRGPDAPSAVGYLGAHGDRFDSDRGFGWAADLSKNHRKRGALDGPRDSFIFTRSKDRWELSLAAGDYRVLVCVGDSNHPQTRQAVVIEGQDVVDDRSTLSGRFLEAECDVRVDDGRLTVDVGSGFAGSNTCLNWLIVLPGS